MFHTLLGLERMKVWHRMRVDTVDLLANWQTVGDPTCLAQIRNEPLENCLDFSLCVWVNETGVGNGRISRL